MLKALSPLPIALKTTPYLSDHRFQNKVIYPAVEIMESLAESTRSCQPGVDLSIITDARFDRFVETENPATAAVFNDIFIGEDGKVISKLLTQRRSRTGITRTLSHASMRFQGPWDYGPSLPKDLASGLEGVCVRNPRRTHLPGTGSLRSELSQCGGSIFCIRERGTCGSAGWEYPS